MCYTFEMQQKEHKLLHKEHKLLQKEQTLNNTSTTKRTETYRQLLFIDELLKQITYRPNFDA